MQKNVSSQSVSVLAIDTATNLPKTGDASNITLYYNGDGGGVTVFSTNSGHPTEDDNTNALGVYTLGLSQSETNYDRINITGKSSTSGIRVLPILNIQTVAAKFNLLSVNASGRVDVGLINSVSTTGVTAVGANIGTAQPINFTGTSTTAYVKSDMVDIAGSAVSTSTAQLGVNVVNFGGSAGTFSSGKPAATLASTDVTGNVAADVQTIKTQTVTCAGGVTVPAATLASTTNITAGTITTVTTTTTATNLTNAPTAGDFTTAMKTSLNNATPAVTVSDKTGFSLANGSFVTATFGVCDFTSTQKTSITTAATAATPTVTAGTVSDKTGYSLSNGSFVTATFGTCDFTSTQKTSIGTAVAASAVASVTGNVGGNVTGTVGGMTAGGWATAFTVNSTKTYADAVAGSVVSEIAVNAGSGGGGTDWTTTERQQIRYQLGIDGASSLPATGVVHIIPPSVANVVAQTADIGDRIGANLVMTAGKVWALDGSGNAIAPASDSSAIKTVTDHLATALELHLTAYRFTVAALANAPSGGGGGGSLTTPLTEDYAAVNDEASAAQLLYAIYAIMTNAQVSGTTMTAKKLDGTTTAFTLTLDSASTPTAIHRAT